MLSFSKPRGPVGLAAFDAALAIRALAFVGRRYKCPCCGWRLRTFTHGGASLRSRPSGYCPRCNAKARHRRDWLYLADTTNLFAERLRLLHVSPKYSLARRLHKMPNLDYVAVDIEYRPYTSVRADLANLPLQSNQFDAAICIHVLEHVADDTTSMAELFRVLKPGGWALISVPIRLGEPTYEDASITTPAERKRAFGETSHLRYYGYDLVDRLENAGFEVTMDAAADLTPNIVTEYGLKRDENVFMCVKPVGS